MVSHTSEAAEVLESSRSNRKIGATSSAWEVGVLDEDDFEPDGEMEDENEDNEDFTFEDWMKNGFWRNMFSGISN